MPQLFSDRQSIINNKLLLYTVLLEKIFSIINQFNNIYRKRKEGTLEDKDLSQDEDWKLCWQNLMELYDFIEFDYLPLLKNKYANETKENIEKYLDNDIKKMKEISDRYKDIDEVLNFDDLKFFYTNIRFVTTEVGLHNINYTKGRNLDLYGTRDFDENADFSWVYNQLRDSENE